MVLALSHLISKQQCHKLFTLVFRRAEVSPLSYVLCSTHSPASEFGGQLGEEVGGRPGACMGQRAGIVVGQGG